MKAFGTAIRGVCGLALVASGVGACSDGASSGPTRGVATVAFTPKPLALPAYLDLARAQIQLDRVLIIGNMPPPPPPGEPFPDRPPPGDHPPPLPDVSLDALSTAGSSATFENLPQGLYSWVRFTLGRISLEGTARGTVFNVSIAPFGVIVDRRASVPQELGLDRDIHFPVSVDPNVWFPPYLFDGAMLDNRGEIVVDEVSNPQIGMTLTQAMAKSFSLP
jgi:hypothetical protein